MLGFQWDAAGDLSPFPDIEHAITPERPSLITYPHEWGFDQLKDAAINTLELNLLALEHGLTLKDASAFNNQRHQGRMVFIDHLSFEEKLKIVRSLFADQGYGTVWDLGGNDGTFSREIIGHCRHVLTLDIDHNAINAGYNANERAGHAASIR